MIDIPAIERAIARIPYAKTLGITPAEMDGEFTLILPYIKNNIGNISLPALHGGAISGFMEMTAISKLLLTASDQGTKYKALPKPIGINVDYLRKGKPETTYARAVIFKLSLIHI